MQTGSSYHVLYDTSNQFGQTFRLALESYLPEIHNNKHQVP